MAPPALVQDSLLLLRQAVTSGAPPIPTAEADPSAPEVPLAQARSLRFVHGGGGGGGGGSSSSSSSPPVLVPIDAPTRFFSGDSPVTLRSIFFAWLNREVAIPEYNSAAASLNKELEPLAGAEPISTLGFVERVDLFTWLEGATQDSDYIRSAAGDGSGAGAAPGAGFAFSAAADASARSAAQRGGSASAPGLGRAGKGTIDPRLLAIYGGERRMGDRNSILRGIKPTDFSHVRKLAIQFVQKKHPPHGDGGSAAAIAAAGELAASHPSLSLNQKPARRPDPIILLSPSASALLRMSNARAFLEGGSFTPPDHTTAAATNLLHVSRLMRDIDPTRPMRFVLVESTEQFKPEYWNRIVAVFTTGQPWQFKAYKWSRPEELFKHVPGVFLGWKGDEPPAIIRTWGQRVLPVAVDRWRAAAAGSAVDATRFKDREVVEQIWRMIELNMLSRGWRKDSAPAGI